LNDCFLCDWFDALAVKHLLHLEVVLTEHIHIAVDADAAHIGEPARKLYVGKLYKLVSVKVEKKVSCFVVAAAAVVDDAKTDQLILTVYVTGFT